MTVLLESVNLRSYLQCIFEFFIALSIFSTHLGIVLKCITLICTSYNAQCIVLNVYAIRFVCIDPPQILPSHLTTPELGQLVVSIGVHTEVTVYTGATVLVYCNVTGTPTIEWFKDGIQKQRDVYTVSISSSHLYTTKVLTIYNFQPRNTGIYKCVATNIAGIDSGNVTLRSQLFTSV